MKNKAIRRVIKWVAIIILVVNLIYNIISFSTNDFQFWLVLVGISQLIVCMVISDYCERFKNAVSNCIPISIGFAVFTALYNLTTLGLIKLSVEKIFYSGMLTMGLGLVAAVFTLHGKRVITTNKPVANASLPGNRDSRLLMCLLLPLTMMLLSSIGLIGIKITPSSLSLVGPEFFDKPDLWPLIVLSAALSSWIYVADLSLDTLNSDA